METVFDALKAMGKATSIELAARLDISREEVLNELWELKKAGFVDKSAYTWRVADNNVQQEQPMQAELPEETTTATVVKISECDLTATIEQRGPQTADDLVLPSLHMANRELRRAKNHVQKWERVCAALRELNKHRDIVRQIVDSSSRIVSEK